MTTYTLFGQGAETPDGNGAGNAGTVGVHFTVSAACTLTGIWQYSPSSESVTQLPTTIGLFNYTTQTLIHSETPSWSGAAGSGWVFAAFASPPSLVSGTQYTAAVFRDDATNVWFCFDGSYTWPVTNGILTAPADVGLGQGWYNNSSVTAITFPASQLAGYNFYVDVQVSTSSAAASPQPPKAARGQRAAGKSRLRSSPGSPAVLPVPHPSPFTPPPKAVRGRPAARKGRLSGSPGSPYAAAPPPSGGYLLTEAGGRLLTEAGSYFLTEAGAPAAAPPFTVPGAVTRGKAAARKARLRSSPGSPAVLPPPAVPSPFAVPPKAVRGKAAARKSRLGGSPGSPVVTSPPPSPSPFAVPGSATRGKAVLRKARLAASPGSPVVLPSPATPSPFTVPGALRRAHAAIRKARLASSAGSPAVPSPAPFATPGTLKRAKPALRKARTASSAGSPAQVAPAVPSPFAVPPKTARGKAVLRKSRLAGSAGSPVVLPPPVPPPVFPAVPLDLRCELLLGTTYTDVTTYAYQREGSSPPISITRGRPDESSQANPATASWEWNNRDGRFSPKNPLSPYFGQLGRNTPVRWSVRAASTYLRLEAGVGAYAYAPEASRLDVTGSLEVRIALRMSDWRACDLASKYDGSGSSSWIWNTDTDGTLQFWWRDSGGTLWHVQTTAPLAVGTKAVRVTLDATTGTVTHYTSTSIDGTWTQLGTAASATGGAATSVFSGSGSSVPLTVGWSANNATWQLYGRVTGFRLYNGIGGTVVADAAFSAQTAGASSWADSPGNTWTVTGGAELSGRDYRFHGEMSAQPPKWDVTGTDQAVMAAAGGPLRRLSQGTANAMSAMKRAILAQSGALAPVAYWPLEDAAGASVFGASLGGLPMTFDQNPAPDLATDSSFIASAPLPTLNGSRLYGRVAPYSGGNSIIVRWLCKLGTVTLLPGLTYAPLARISTSGSLRALYVVAFAGSGTLGMIGYDSTGTDVINTGPLSYGAAGTPLYYSLEIQLVAGNVQASLVTLAPGASSGLAETVTLTGGTVGNCSVVALNPNALFTDTVVGHVTLQTTDSSLFALGQPLNGWTGELAAARYARLAGENGYQARIMGSPAQSALMGPQSVATLSSLLTEVEAADLGQQYEPRQVLALGYRTLASMCAQPPRLTLDYAASQPGGVNGDGGDSGLDPTYDDQLLANDWTVTRGSSTGSQGATVQVQLDDGSALSISDPPVGVGDYAKTQTANVESDAQLQDVAGWMVHAGTVDQARWPGIPVNLARSEIQNGGLYYPVLDTDIGDYLELLNLPDVVLYDPVKQLLFGSKESLGGFHHTVEFNAVPEVPYEVIVLDDPVYGRVDTDGSTLQTTAAYPQSSLSVSTDAGFPLWTTSAADFPFDINVSGMRLTVTNITGSTSPQAFTVTPAVNGVEKSLAAGSDVRLFFPPILALT